MPRLFTVKIETETVVLAENEREAEEVAEQAVRDGYVLDNLDAYASPMSYFPPEWDVNCIPYQNNQHEEKTVGAWIALGSAPAYTALQLKLSQRKPPETP